MTTTLIKFCKIAQQRDDFIGVCFEQDTPSICFPYGYRINQSNENEIENEIECRKDILNLLTILSTYQKEDDNIGVNQIENQPLQKFPLHAYMVIIQDFLRHGYYTVRETQYTSATSGKVHWKRTIAKEKPVVQSNGIAYLKMQVKKHYNNHEHLITEIHRHCVYESFIKMGWYYGLTLPAKPTSIFVKPSFIATIREQLYKTNKDNEKLLFQNMLYVLEHTDGKNHLSQKFRFGTNKFEKVWEKLVDRTFGRISDQEKKKYFPKAQWKLADKIVPTNELYPDTIMLHDKKLYVIDAKYYRYGITNDTNHLPEMSSIGKQVIYAQYIAGNKEIDVSPNQIRNIFMLPTNKGNHQDNYHCIGYAQMDWSEIEQEYSKIYTILADTKHLMQNHSMQSSEIEKLSALIEQQISNPN